MSGGRCYLCGGAVEGPGKQAHPQQRERPENPQRRTHGALARGNRKALLPRKRHERSVVQQRRRNEGGPSALQGYGSV